MSRQYTHVQGLLPSVIAMKEKGYTYRQIADQFGMEKEQIEELCSQERRKQRKIEKGYIPQPKGRPRKTPATQEQLQSNRIVELEMKVELLQNFLSECGRIDLLLSGEVDLLNKMVAADTISKGIQSTADHPFSVANYPRSGLSMISFSCERQTVSGKAVRQAIASCFDRDTLVKAYTGNFGLNANGYFGIGQWMYQLAAGTIQPPVVDLPANATAKETAAYEKTVNRTGIRDKKLYQLAVDMRKTKPGDVLSYCQKWVAFQERWTEVLPAIPVYSNVYFDFYTTRLQNYRVTENQTWTQAIVGATLTQTAE